jgi:LytR cell envelope-related transcriptional attenuator
MVHLAPIPPWRRRAQRIVGSLLAALGVVVLVIAIIALRQPNGHQAALRTSAVADSSSTGSSAPAPSSTPPASSTTPTSSSPAAPTTSASATTDPLKAIPLIVLNNTSKTGLADTAAGRFRAGGWTVTSTGNLVNTIASTVAYYDPSVANAQAAATALQAQFPAIKRVVAKFSGLPAGPIIVVLTSDYS